MIEIPEPRDRPHGDPRKAIHSGPYQRAGNRLGKVNAISLHQQPDGTTSIHVMTPADNSSPPYLTYTRRPDGTIHMTKQGLTHHGPITGHDPKKELGSVDISPSFPHTRKSRDF